MRRQERRLVRTPLEPRRPSLGAALERVQQWRPRGAQRIEPPHARGTACVPVEVHQDAAESGGQLVGEGGLPHPPFGGGDGDDVRVRAWRHTAMFACSLACPPAVPACGGAACDACSGRRGRAACVSAQHSLARVSAGGARELPGHPPTRAPGRARHHQLLGPAALHGDALARESVPGTRMAGDGLAGARHRGHVVALARAGRTRCWRRTVGRASRPATPHRPRPPRSGRSRGVRRACGRWGAGRAGHPSRCRRPPRGAAAPGTSCRGRCSPGAPDGRRSPPARGRDR